MLPTSAAAEVAQRVERQRATELTGQGTQDRPVLSRLAGREHRAARKLDATLGIYVSPVLFGIGGGRQYDVGPAGAAVAVMPLIDHKSPAQIAGVDLVGAEKVEHFDIARPAAGENTSTSRPPGPGTKPRSRPPTRAAA